MCSTDQVCWRNNAGTADLCINKNASDQLFFGTNPFAFLNIAQTWTAQQTFPLPLGLTQAGFTHSLTATTTGARTWTLQDASDTFVFRATTDTLTNKTFDISLNTLKTATNTAGHYPRNNGTQYVDAALVATDLPAGNSCAAHNFATALTAGLVLSCVQPSASDLTNGTTGTGAVVLTNTPTIATPVINGASTGTGVQGTDSKLLTSGTISGTSSPLCTDANGGATTSSCSVVTGATKVQALIITTGICTTGGAETKCTSGPYNWPVAFADASYAVTCSAANPTGTGTNPGMYGPYPTTQTASQISVIIQSGSASAAGSVTTATIWCIGVHP